MDVSAHPSVSHALRRGVAVFGGANTDIAGFARNALVARDSNPGHVRVSAGGVGRNVAENLARLGVHVRLVTAFGGDANALALMRECRDAGIDIEASVSAPDLPGSVYLSIMDERGDMALALSDMRALDGLTPDVLEQHLHVLESAALVVLDTNLPADSIEWLVERATIADVPVVLDTVSVAKAGRARAVLPRLDVLKTSGLEAGVLLGRDIRNRDHAEAAAGELVALGVRAAFVTAGAFGAAWADGSDTGHVPAPRITDVANATGAGDAFAAGVAFGTLQRWSVVRAAVFASACAALTLETEETVSELLTRERALERAKEWAT